MKKTLRWLIVLLLSTSMVVAFSIYGCKAKEAVEEETVVEEEAATAEEEEPWICGYIGALATDVGRSSQRIIRIAIDEINEQGGILGRPVEYVEADATEDPTEGIKAYEHLVETLGADFIVSGCIDDVSLGWLSRCIEYKIPLLETWTSAIRAIEIVHDQYEEGGKCYFMDHMNDYDQGAGHVAFAKDFLADKMGWDTCVLFYEDTAYGHGVAEFIRDNVGPTAGIDVLGEVVYDIDTVDWAPVYSKVVDYDPDFIFIISSVNGIVVNSAYVELEVPLPMVGNNEAASSAEFWDDMGGLAGGLCGAMPPPTLGLEWDPVSQALIDEYKSRWSDRPIFPHFNGFNAYYGIYMMKEAAERAGGFNGEYLDAFVEEMEKTDFIIWRYGGYERNDDLSPTGEDIKWFYYKFYGPDEDYTHSCVLDQTGENGRPGTMYFQWKAEKQEPLEATVGLLYPDRWANSEFMFMPWIPEEKRGE